MILKTTPGSRRNTSVVQEQKSQNTGVIIKRSIDYLPRPRGQPEIAQYMNQRSLEHNNQRKIISPTPPPQRKRRQGAPSSHPKSPEQGADPAPIDQGQKAPPVKQKSDTYKQEEEGSILPAAAAHLQCLPAPVSDAHSAHIEEASPRQS